MSEQTPGGNASQSQEPRQNAGGKPKGPGNYLMDPQLVPPEIREFVANRMEPKDANGNRLLNDTNQPVRAEVMPARENGSYYGPVVFNNAQFMVQAVGKNQQFAVVHDKRDVELQGPSLQDRDAKRQLNGAVVQVHYNGERAKAYPYKQKEQTRDQAQEAPKPPKAPELTREGLVASAVQYAASNLRANQREAFIKNFTQAVTNATEQQQKPAGELSNDKKAPELKQKTAEMER